MLTQAYCNCINVFVVKFNKLKEKRSFSTAIMNYELNSDRGNQINRNSTNNTYEENR